MAYLVFALCALASTTAMALTPKELEAFLSSPSMDMSRSEAHQAAEKHAPILTKSMVTIADLTNLKDVLYSTEYLDFTKREMRALLLPYAERHLDPADVKQMFDVLHAVKGLDLRRSWAKGAALEMVMFDADPLQVKELYGVLRETIPSLTKLDAQAKALELGSAGCDPIALKNSYVASSDLASASKSAMRANLNGEVRRYCKDGKAYTVAETQSYYGAQFMTEWLAAPVEKRVANDGKEYSAREFRAHYGSSWEQRWDAAHTSTQMRLAQDGKAYSMADFVAYYKDSWQQEWSMAPVLPCRECHTSQNAVMV